MFMVAFHHKNYNAILEVMFDKREDAELIMDKFEEWVKNHSEATIRIESKFGVTILDPYDYSSAVLSDLEQTEELGTILGSRRARMEHIAQEEFERWLKTRKKLISTPSGSVVKMPM